MHATDFWATDTHKVTFGARMRATRRAILTDARNGLLGNGYAQGIYQYLVATRTSHKNANTLLRIVTHPNFDPMALRFRSIEAYHRRVDALQQDGKLYKKMHEAIDGDQIVVFFSDKAWTWRRKSFRALPPASSARGRSRQPLNPRQVKEHTGNSWRRAGLS